MRNDDSRKQVVESRSIGMLEKLVNLFRPVHFRGKARLLHALTEKRGERRATIFGAILDLDLEDYIQRSVYLGTFEPDETRMIARHLHEGMTFVDVGANVGYFTALGAARVGRTGRVVAFEPSPYAFRRLQSMVKQNHLSQVETCNVALGDCADRLNLYLGVNSVNHTPTMIPHENTTTTSVEVRTLDVEMDRLGVKKIDLMKIDVEGYEPKVLAGAKRLLTEKRIRAILCEFNESWLEKAGSSSAELARLMADAGLIDRSRRKRSMSFDNRLFQLDQH